MKNSAEIYTAEIFRERINDNVFVFDIIASKETNLVPSSKIGCIVLNIRTGNFNYHGLVLDGSEVREKVNNCKRIALNLKIVE